MKKRVIVFFFAGLVFLGRNADAQVYNGNLLFTNQTDIDNFSSFSYTSVNGTLEINDALDGQHDIRNLAGLAGLASVNGYVLVRNNNLLNNTVYLNLISVAGATFANNPALTTLNGMTGLVSFAGQLTIESNATLSSITAFSGLTAIGLGVYIQHNPLLTNLNGFSNLVTVSRSCIIGYNNNLVNLNGFGSLVSVGTTLSIRYNPALTSVTGLQALQRVSMFELYNNPLLPHLNELTNLKVVRQGFIIHDNPLLQNINGLSNLDTLGGTSIIKNNNALSVISGFSQLTHMGSMYIELNPALTTISGFPKVKSAATFSLVRNMALTSVASFPILDTMYSLISDHSENLTTFNAFPNLIHVSTRLAFTLNYALTTVNAMPQLDSVGSVEMVADSSLPHLNFLSNLRKTGRLVIRSCHGITSLNFLANLHLVKGDLDISSNRRLASINALLGIASVGGSLIVGYHPALPALQGLENITNVGGDLYLTSNPQLLNINELIRLDSIKGILSLIDNTMLPNLNGLFNLRKAYGVVIQSNAALAEFCGLYRLYSGGGPGSGYSIINQNLVNPTPAQIVASGACTGTVPVRLLFFNLQCHDNNLKLNWKTASEENSSHFTVEKSSDGRQWTGIANIPAAGNSTVEKTYSFTDNNTALQLFYRLAQHDIDGRVRYSGILKSSCGSNNMFTAYPNPVTDKLFVSITADHSSKAFVKLYDSKGATIKKQEAFIIPGTNQLVVEMKKFAKGIYHLNIEWNDGALRKNISVVKQ